MSFNVLTGATQASQAGEVNTPINPTENSADYFGLFAYMHPMHAALDKGIRSLEKILNVAGYIPFVSSISGTLRVALGKVEIIGAIAAGALLGIKGIFAPTAELRSTEINYAIGVAATYSLHGFANIGRGIVEVIPLFGNISTLVYDSLGNRVQYPFEAV